MPSPPPTLPLDLTRSLFDAVPDVMFFVKDREARYVTVNAQMVRRSGKQTSAEVLGRTVAELFPGAFGRNTTAADLAVIRRGEAVLGRLELYHVPDGAAGGAAGGAAVPGRAAEPLGGRWCVTHKYPLPGEPGLVGISRDLPGPDRQSGLYAQLTRVSEHIAAHLGETLRVPDLARIAGLSEDRLERAARQVFGLTPKQLVMKARLEAASELLRAGGPGGMSVSEIAHRCGYADHSAFTRQFRAAVGLTPTQFRG